MRRSWLHVATIALGSTSVVALLNFWLFDHLGGQSPLLFFAAVMFSAWLGGTRAGLLATVLATAFNLYFFTEPDYAAAMRNLQTSARTLIFVAEGVLISLMAGRLHAESRRAEQAVRARDEFLAVASHELKNPVTTLRTALASLTTSGEKTQEQRLTVARRQVDRLVRLVEDLLQIGQLASGGLRLQREEVDLGELTKSLVTLMEPEAKRVGSTLQLHTDGRVVGSWDRLRVEQVVMNLISNAIKYGRGQPIDVNVGVVGDRGRIVVADHGMGIPEGEKGLVFERFGRASAAVAKKIEGVGIGLWVVREIVRKHGGEIDLETHVGEGTTFTVDLPLAA
ncbi:MAG: sensor histidine kinase [Polyangiales bacterium]